MCGALTVPRRPRRSFRISQLQIEEFSSRPWRGAAALSGGQPALKCFEHDVEVTGLPVRQAPYRLKGQDEEALERCVAEDLLAGQLVPGEGDEQWLSPAFVVRYPKVRMVVDTAR